MDIRSALAGELRAERARQGITIHQWADAAGLQWRSLQRYLTGERQPRLEDLDALAKVFGLRASTFLARAEAVMREDDDPPSVLPGELISRLLSGPNRSSNSQADNHAANGT